MAASDRGCVVVFGGSGFVGTHTVRALVKEGWRVRVATRRPHIHGDLRVIGKVGQVQIVQANLRYKQSVEAALEGADAVINLVGILHEAGNQKFNSLHAEGVKTLAKAAAERGITNFVHMSAIGADLEAQSEYSKTKAQGEAFVRESQPGASIVRPSIIFGQEDNFFNKFASMSQMAPALPLIGGGQTRFQPVYVSDVARAIATLVTQGSDGQVYELGGPRSYSFKELLSFTLEAVDRKRLLAPVPWPFASLLGLFGEISGALPFVSPFLTRDQVVSLKTDNVVSDDALGFADLNITPEALEAIVPAYLTRFKKYGQFHADTPEEALKN